MLIYKLAKCYLEKAPRRLWQEPAITIHELDLTPRNLVAEIEKREQCGLTLYAASVHVTRGVSQDLVTYYPHELLSYYYQFVGRSEHLHVQFANFAVTVLKI